MPVMLLIYGSSFKALKKSMTFLISIYLQKELICSYAFCTDFLEIHDYYENTKSSPQVFLPFSIKRYSYRSRLGSETWIKLNWIESVYFMLNQKYSKLEPVKSDSLFSTFLKKMYLLSIRGLRLSEAAHFRCSYKKVFWNYAANLQENTHAQMWFQ